MTKKRNNKKQKDEGKILFGDNKTICFACGEKIDLSTEVCPFCKTSLKQIN